MQNFRVKNIKFKFHNKEGEKKRAEKYHTKLSIDGTLSDLLKVSVIHMPKQEMTKKKAAKKK